MVCKYRYGYRVIVDTHTFSDTTFIAADPHGGNLLKIKRPEGNHLGYLDFGILSTVPEQVRDALVCAIAYLVFENDVEAVASLFGELQLLPPEILEDKNERAALTAGLTVVLGQALVYQEKKNGEFTTKIPVLKFDKVSRKGITFMHRPSKLYSLTSSIHEATGWLDETCPSIQLQIASLLHK